MPDPSLQAVFTVENQAYSIKSLVEADLAELLAIEQRSHRHPWSAQNILSSLQKHQCLGLCANGEWIGYAIFSFAAGEAELLLFVLDKPWQGRGLAAAFLEELLPWCAKRAQTIFLEVRANNHSAIALYEAVGFNQVGERPNYYPLASGRGETALIYAYQGTAAQ